MNKQANKLQHLLHVSLSKYSITLFPQVRVKSGCLECPESHRQFSIRDGIPNMLQEEEED